ncbi:M28 family metallopeptidase [Novosphingobium colocasiae]|uniref:M28 family metallopeptidase n=1 Tax=Novosphingobium colocasiae TaxID=1256513 RepID=UPI0035AE739B
MKKLLPLAAGLLITGCAMPQTPPQSAASPSAISVDTLKSVTERLSADDFEGRAPSTATEPMVLDYIVSTFRKAGLKPGYKGQWLQEVPTVEITGDHYSPLTVSGAGKPLQFAFGSDYVGVSYRPVPHTALKDAELVFVGYGINAPELGWNDYAGIDMKGKIAVILVNDADYANATEDGPFKGRRMTWYGRWPYKYEEAARQGAAGAIIIHDTFPAAYGWNVVNSSWTGAQYYVKTPQDGMDQTQFNGWLQKPAAEAILKAAGKDLASLTAAAQKAGFRAVPLGLKASVAFDNTVRRSTSHNVVGVLPGTSRPEEAVLYSAHWDHLGRCTPDASGDDICNGAVDNATGVAALAAIAEAESKAGGAARSQVFVALTLEESGLLGSAYYAQDPAVPLDHTVGGVNMDALAPGGRARDYAMIGGDKSDLTALFRKELAAEGLVESAEEGTEKGHYYRSDHFSLAKRGVPMFNLGRGVDLVNGGKAAGEAADADYTQNRYHQPGDEYSADWNWDGIVEDVTLFYRLGRALADSDAWPNWHEGDEFRAIRDASCAKATGGCHK